MITNVGKWNRRARKLFGCCVGMRGDDASTAAPAADVADHRAPIASGVSTTAAVVERSEDGEDAGLPVSSQSVAETVSSDDEGTFAGSSGALRTTLSGIEKTIATTDGSSLRDDDEERAAVIRERADMLRAIDEERETLLAGIAELETKRRGLVIAIDRRLGDSAADAADVEASPLAAEGVVRTGRSSVVPAIAVHERLCRRGPIATGQRALELRAARNRLRQLSAWKDVSENRS